MSEESTLSFRGLCRYIHRLSKASKAGMKAALADCPKCHFPMLEGLLGCIRLHGQDGAVYISDLVQELHQPLPAISRTVRQMEQDGLVERFADPADRRKTLVRITPAGERARKANEQAMNDYFARIMARLTPDQLAQANAVKDALLAAIEAENAAMKTDLKGEPPHDENF